MLSSLAEIIRDLLLFSAFMAALLITLLVIVSKLPDDNPLKQILVALSTRIMATLLAGIVAIPVEVIPVIDLLYDLGMPLFLAVYWLGFFRLLFTAGGHDRLPPNPPLRLG